MKQKIAIVANSTWNIYNYRQNVIQILIEHGHDVYVLAPIDEYISYKDSFPTVHHMDIKSLDRNSTNPIKDCLLIVELYKKYKRVHFDFIIHYTHKPNIFGSLAAYLIKIRSVAVVTGLGYGFIKNRWLKTLMTALYKVSAGKKELMIFLNEDDQNLFIKSNIIPRDKTVVIPGSGVDTNHFKITQNDHSTYQNHFTFIGRLLKDKGINEFLDAAKILKEKYEEKIKFTVLGEFDFGNPSTIDRNELLKWIDLGIIDYQGFVKDIRPYIADSDCIILPSYREGIPRTLLESMAMSKPIITTDTPGCKETIEEGVNGFLVEARNVESLVAGVEKFISLSSNEKLAMGLSGRYKAESTYDSKIVAKEFYKHIKKFL